MGWGGWGWIGVGEVHSKGVGNEHISKFRFLQLPEATIGCLLSVGCGTYPPEVLKDFNPSIHLFVGKRLNTPLRFMHQIEELIKLLATAVSLCYRCPPFSLSAFIAVLLWLCPQPQ